MSNGTNELDRNKRLSSAHTRLEKARELAFQLGAVSRIDEHSYKVKSQTTSDQYDVLSTEHGWICSCCDHVYRGVECKHILAVKFSLAVRKQVATQVTIQPLGLACLYCSSQNFVKDSVRHNKGYDLQRYRCKDCGKRFSHNIGFERMRASPQVITAAMQLYFTGESLRNVEKFLRLQGVNISHVAVYKWIGKYVDLMKDYLEQIKPTVSNTWRTDELYLKVSGNLKYLYAIMDDETRFWIAQQVADNKFTQDVRPMFRRAKELAGKRPLTLISDGAHNFAEACKKEYYTMKKPHTKHISHVHMSGDMNNNKMERMNGEVRDREKVMRGLKKMDTAILPGYQIYHNYMRPHEGLDGKTPADAAGISIEGQNKWLTLIQNASKASEVNKS